MVCGYIWFKHYFHIYAMVTIATVLSVTHAYGTVSSLVCQQFGGICPAGPASGCGRIAKTSRDMHMSAGALNCCIHLYHNTHSAHSYRVFIIIPQLSNSFILYATGGRCKAIIIILFYQ